MPSTVTWLGSATLRIDSVSGKRIYVDPWLSGPNTPEGERVPDQVDIIAVTHGHVDHIGDTIELSNTHECHVIAQTDLVAWLDRNGARIKDPWGINKGGTVVLDGIAFTMVYASHSSSTPGLEYAGEAAGYVITLEDGAVIYVAGDTDVFLDMQLIGELYRPDVAVLPIGDRMTMGPRQAAKAAKLLGVTRVFPYHWGGDIQPGRPQHLAEMLGRDSGVEVIQLPPGGAFHM